MYTSWKFLAVLMKSANEWRVKRSVARESAAFDAHPFKRSDLHNYDEINK